MLSVPSGIAKTERRPAPRCYERVYLIGGTVKDLILLKVLRFARANSRPGAWRVDEGARRS